MKLDMASIVIEHRYEIDEVQNMLEFVMENCKDKEKQDIAKNMYDILNAMYMNW